jgi:hypothetical protein
MSITLTRQELYDPVWAEPVDTLAEEFGLSTSASAKPAAGTTSLCRHAANRAARQEARLANRSAPSPRPVCDCAPLNEAGNVATDIRDRAIAPIYSPPANNPHAPTAVDARAIHAP